MIGGRKCVSVAALLYSYTQKSDNLFLPIFFHSFENCFLLKWQEVTKLNCINSLLCRSNNIILDIAEKLLWLKVREGRL